MNDSRRGSYVGLITPVTADIERGLFNRSAGCNLLPEALLRNMALADSSSFKAKLVGKRVIVKVSLFSRAFPGAIADTDETGFCFQSDEMVQALRESTGSIMANIDAPSLYLPFSSLEWLVFSAPKAAAASA
jgi:hypothetical protein